MLLIDPYSWIAGTMW